MEVEDRRLRAAAAREAFLRGPPADASEAGGVSDLVRASWLRSRGAGVDAHTYAVELHEDVDFDSRLVRCARPVIERLSDQMVDVPVTIALADAGARIVDRLDCSTSVARVLDHVDFHKGFAFDEDGVGTNGIGTVYASGSSVAVVGAEHFSEELVRFACTGAPILHPVTGRVEGVLDLSCLAESWSPIMQVLVRSAADEIARQLLLDRHEADRALFERYLLACRRPRRAVLAIGSALTMVNEVARACFDPADLLLLQQHGRSLLVTSQDQAPARVDLSGGRVARLRASWVAVGDRVAGVVLQVSEDPAPPTRVPLPRRPVAAAPVSAGWRRARTEVGEAVATHAALLLLGEAGSGRATLVTDRFRAARPQGRVVTHDLTGHADGLADGLADGHGDDRVPTLVLLRHLDALDPRRLAGLGERLRAWRVAGHLVAATASVDAAPGRPSYAPLLAHFERCVTLPPLRERGDDLAALVTALLAELAPGRRVRVSPEAMRLLLRHAWPRNLTQLREALTAALAQRPVGELGARDLPGYCHTTGTRLLTPLEAAERDALVQGLRQHDGNRLRAAAHLGMSRSSLYRKLDRYGITGL